MNGVFKIGFVTIKNNDESVRILNALATDNFCDQACQLCIFSCVQFLCVHSWFLSCMTVRVLRSKEVLRVPSWYFFIPVKCFL